MSKKMQLQCPMPKFDFDFITMGHGSGGLLTQKLLESGVFDLLSNEKLDHHHDGAVIEAQGSLAFSTDSFVISPIFFPGGNIGELAVNGTVNDIAMCGAVPKYISLSFILEEGLPMEEFWDVLVGVKTACEAAGVQVITGDTKVVEKGKGDKVFINTTGIGIMHPEADIGLKNVKSGDKIIVSNQIARHGIAILSRRQGLEFESTIESDTTNLNREVIALLDEFGKDIHLFRDPTRGGLAATLNEIAKETRTGILLNDEKIPIDRQVKSACELLGLDPLYIANEGVFIAVVDASIADQAVEKLKSLDKTRYASVIGTVTSAHPEKVIIQNIMGGKRVVGMAVGEQLPRIC